MGVAVSAPGRVRALAAGNGGGAGGGEAGGATSGGGGGVKERRWQCTLWREVHVVA